jgi:hypothetical protein
VFFLSAVLSFAGLISLKRWGFIFVYVYIAIATFFFATSVLPFPLSLLNLDVKGATKLLLTINLGVLLFTGLIHAAKAKEHKSLDKAS